MSEVFVSLIVLYVLAILALFVLTFVLALLCYVLGMKDMGDTVGRCAVLVLGWLLPMGLIPIGALALAALGASMIGA